MDKAEALVFIGLKEPLNEDVVRDKYKERFNYFRMLYSNAPSKAVEQIQQQNLQKLKLVKKMLLDEITAKKNRVDREYDDVRPALKPESLAIETKPLVGWLIVHTEHKEMKTFDLYEGVNYIGRKKSDDKANRILIEDDPFVSRTHAFIKCKKVKGKLQFQLYDGDGSKPSANGVFINGNEKRIKEYCLLQENDTVQIGTTKLVFKVRKDDRSISGEVDEIMRTDFVRTIDVRK